MRMVRMPVLVRPRFATGLRRSWLPGLQGRIAELGWAMDEELEKQLARIEQTVAEILDAVKKLHASQFAADEINQTLRRFLEREK